MTFFFAAVVYLVIRDAPTPLKNVHREPLDVSKRMRGLLGDIRLVWREPGVKLGAWMHFTATLWWLSFMLLWGYPFLTRGVGLGTQTASQLLTMLVITNMAVGPFFGYLASKLPAARGIVNASVIGSTAAAWAIVLLWPGRPPVAMLAVLVAVLGACGPASMLGVDIARTSSSPEHVATAAAMANVGGFVGGMLAILFIGVGLQAAEAAGAAPADAFTMAFASQFLLLVCGGMLIFRWRRRMRSRRTERAVIISNSCAGGQ